MTLVALTIVAIACLIAALAVYLFIIGAVLSRTADGLGDCLQNLQLIARQAQPIGPGVNRINKTGEDLVGAMPLLLEDAESVATKLAPAEAAPANSTVDFQETGPATAQRSVGYQDPPTPKSGVGYLDV
jgi:type II secretory pathway pseudopilin PulG